MNNRGRRRCACVKVLRIPFESATESDVNRSINPLRGGRLFRCQQFWSCEAPGFVIENEEILRSVHTGMRHVVNKGIYVCNRGGDRINLFYELLDRKALILVRLLGMRPAATHHGPVRGKCRKVTLGIADFKYALSDGLRAIQQAPRQARADRKITRCDAHSSLH